ncbi:MAG: TetR/AcrR family transcriptional regulator [Albidovulum sp.]|uniref:TetR/AcrR family transcriptional regulator n=1 Tax=Albidovulum sp. TaxID=1872424 RepID=UPI003CBCB747
MARPREFDEDDAIEKALGVFWALGYDGTALPDLLTGMGLTRGSVYKAFKSKKALFLTVLDRYETEAVAMAVNMLTDPAMPNGRDRIMALFNHIALVAEAGDRRGCLLCSAAAGPAATDPEIAGAVERGLGQIRDGFEMALSASDIPGMHEAGPRADRAEALITFYVGMRILARSEVRPGGQKASTRALSSLLGAAI